ncbi:PIN domain-containing protein [Patescibacteria group bacterium]|nr:PIN domain-containing protein [Patescibacteria group bacterium]MBU4098589.1 PIN domain-containing protein [Patescibacteria group bacterium]
MDKRIVVDSDAIFAIYNPNDPLNRKATKTLQYLITEEYQLVYPTSVLFEVVSLFQRVLPTPKITAKLIEMVTNDQLLIYVVDTDILKESAALFDPDGSKKNTLIDCSVVAIAKKINAEGVFAYDSFYTKQGLKLASDIVISAVGGI